MSELGDAAALADTSLVLALRVVGASHLLLGVGHALLWRLFGWTKETATLTPLTARVFAVHTFFIAFILVGLGALALGRPDLLTRRSDLARLLLGATVAFWVLRLVAQPFVFDPVLLRASAYRWPVRAAAVVVFTSYVAVYAWAFSRQIG